MEKKFLLSLAFLLVLTSVGTVFATDEGNILTPRSVEDLVEEIRSGGGGMSGADADGSGVSSGLDSGGAPESSDDEIISEPGLNDGTSTGTILPGTKKSVDQCIGIMNALNWPDLSKNAREVFEGRKLLTIPQDKLVGFSADMEVSNNDILACGIKTGDIRMWMIPYYIRYILEVIISVAGLVSVGAFVYGGYVYLFAGLSDDKEKGKKAILYSVIGFVMTMLSWALVNIVVSLVT